MTLYVDFKNTFTRSKEEEIDLKNSTFIILKETCFKTVFKGASRYCQSGSLLVKFEHSFQVENVRIQK